MKVALTVVFIVLGFKLLGAVMAYLIAGIVSCIVAFYFLNKIFPLFEKSVKAISITKELLVFSFPLVLAELFVLLLGWTDTLMLGYFKTVSDVGIYNSALPTAQLMNMFPTALIALFLPVMTGLYAKNNITDFSSIYKTVTKWVFMTNSMLLAFFIAFPKEILYVLFGMEYAQGFLVLMILAVGYFVVYFTLTSNNVLIVIKKTKLLFFNSIIVFVCNVALNILLIPYYGLVGAAIASTSSFIAVSILILLETYFIAKVQPFKFDYVKIIFCTALSVVLSAWLVKQLYLKESYTLIIGGIMLLLVYFFSLLILRTFKKEDIMILEVIQSKTKVNLGFLIRLIEKFS